MLQDDEQGVVEQAFGQAPVDTLNAFCIQSKECCPTPYRCQSPAARIVPLPQWHFRYCQDTVNNLACLDFKLRETILHVSGSKFYPKNVIWDAQYQSGQLLTSTAILTADNELILYKQNNVYVSNRSQSDMNSLLTLLFLCTMISAMPAWFVFKRDHTDEAALGKMYCYLFASTTFIASGGPNHSPGSKGQVQLAWLDALYDSDPMN